MAIPRCPQYNKGVASIGLLATSSTRRKCLREFSETSRSGGRGKTMSGWRFFGLFAYYGLLAALAALFAAAFATAPFWIWPA